MESIILHTGRTMNETYTDCCIRIGAISKLPLAAQFDSGEKQPDEILEKSDNYRMQKNYQLRESVDKWPT